MLKRVAVAQAAKVGRLLNRNVARTPTRIGSVRTYCAAGMCATDDLDGPRVYFPAVEIGSATPRAHR
jgi:hypothetical protein